MIQFNAVHQYNLGTTNTDFKMFGISEKLRYFYSRNVLYPDNVLTFNSFNKSSCLLNMSWHGISMLHIENSVFPVQRHVDVSLFELYYINSITLII